VPNFVIGGKGVEEFRIIPSAIPNAEGKGSMVGGGGGLLVSLSKEKKKTSFPSQNERLVGTLVWRFRSPHHSRGKKKKKKKKH